MDESEPQGCLAAILRLFGIRLTKSSSDELEAIDAAAELPYRQRDDFLSAAEFSFYRVLVQSIGDQAVVLAKVNLGDIFFVPRSRESQSYRNKIDRKHVDFLICDPTTMKPRCGLELDDSSHNRPDRQERDLFVDQVFAAARLPLVRIPAQAAYSPANLQAAISPHLALVQLAIPIANLIIPSGPVTCPKCGAAMVVREATKGANAGKQFYGCPNYPRCKEIIRLA